MENITKKVAFHNLGCKVNSYELGVVQQNFVQKGYKIVPFDQNADIYIINTCTVTNIADRKSRQMLHQAKKRNPEAVVVALGCYVQTDKDHVDTDPCIDLAIGNNRKKYTVEIVEAFLEQKEVEDAVIDINHTSEYEEMQLTKPGEHTRAYIKVQDGCNQFCTYCIIPFARGRVRSRKAEDICAEVKGLVASGYKEFVLTGIHISSYGVDLESDLLTLIKMVHAIDGVERLRLGSLEPRIVTEEFAKELAGLDKICPHFHLSLQSGCDETLKRMNRRYTTAEFKEGVARLRSCFDNPAITTDVIAGFPGETEEEFLQTKSYLQEINFFEMHIFPYSVRKGTVAAKMTDQIDAEVKKARAKELIELEESQSEAYRRGFIGCEEEVLFEEEKEIDGKHYMIGHTKRYVKMAKEIADANEVAQLSGNIVSVKAVGMLTRDIIVVI